MSKVSAFSHIDPACGSGSLLVTASEHFGSSSYNNVQPSRLAIAEEGKSRDSKRNRGRSRRRRRPTPRHQSTELEGYKRLLLTIAFYGTQSVSSELEDYTRLLFARAFVDDDESCASPIKIGAWDETEQLFGTTSFKRVYTSPALDLCTVDTLWIALPMSCVAIRDDHQLTIVRPEPEVQYPVLWYDSRGNPVTGRWAIWTQEARNEKRRHKTIRLRIRRRAWIDGVGVGCLLQLEMPAIAGNGDNSWPLNKAFAVATIEIVQETLRSIGVEADLRQGQVVRCDLNRNIVLDAPLHSYELLSRALDQSQTTKIVYAGTGFSCTNKSQSTLLYDKIARMKKAGWRTDHLPRNLTRLEWQVKRAKNVREKLGISTVQDLLDQWYDLPARYHSHKESLFRYDIKEMQKLQPRLEQRGLDAIQAQSRNSVRWCRKRNLRLNLTWHDLDGLVRQGDIREYERIMHSLPGMTDDDHHAATDLVGRMRIAFWRVALRDPDFVAQYEELRSKYEGEKWLPKLSVDALREIDRRWR